METYLVIGGVVAFAAIVIIALKSNSKSSGGSGGRSPSGSDPRKL